MIPVLLFLLPSAFAQPIQPVPFNSVRIQDGFWAKRLETNRTVTIPANFKKSEETGRIDNFAVAAKMQAGEFRGIFYDDSDVFKVIEGAAYSLSLKADPALDKYLDGLIAKIAGAQEPDGYLYTARTINPARPPKNSGAERWSLLQHSHELYNLGHMYEGAVAHFQATGKRTFLDVAIKNANLVCYVFGPNGRTDVPGHQEIEIGLVKLYRATGDAKYLRQARLFVERRGHYEGRVPGTTRKDPAYAQDHLPVTQQTEAVGHAVRALYLYSGMTDVAEATGEKTILTAVDKLWENVVAAKIYLTGGIGARRAGESFGDNYELPNDVAYNETCAAIASVLWNQRLFLLHGDAKYLDVVERTLYNGFLSGVSMQGDTFFYPNPLSADGKKTFNQGSAARQPWFRTSCCPTNVCRFVPSIPGYIFATRGSDIFVNQFMPAKSTAGDVQLAMETNYPWDGDVTITVRPKSAKKFALRMRVPGWARNQPLASDLYRYSDATAAFPAIKVNGKNVPLRIENGFAVIDRQWRPGDTVMLSLPMRIRRVVSNEKVAANQGRVAIERGPLVYCVEGVDNNGVALNAKLSDADPLGAKFEPSIVGGLNVIRGRGLTAIPYYAWAHRGTGEMTVWIERTK